MLLVARPSGAVSWHGMALKNNSICASAVNESSQFQEHAVPTNKREKGLPVRLGRAVRVLSC